MIHKGISVEVDVSFLNSQSIKERSCHMTGHGAHPCNPSKLQVELRGSEEVQSHPQVSSEFRVSLGYMKQRRREK